MGAPLQLGLDPAPQRFDIDIETSKKARELARKNKELWMELKGVQKARKDMCRELSSETDAKIRDIARDLRNRKSRAAAAMR